MDAKEIIARRAAMELHDGDFVNLGIGLPTMISKYLPEGVNLIIHSENGYVGQVPITGEPDKDLVDAGGKPAGIAQGGAFFDVVTSFSLVRGGHIDATVLGGLQVSEKGDIANWMVPGKKVAGMGGAMDLLVGAKKVIITMEHTSGDSPKILENCTLPLTGKECVDLIITEMGVISVTPEGLVLEEIGPNVSLEEIQAKTSAKLIISNDLKPMQI